MDEDNGTNGVVVIIVLVVVFSVVGWVATKYNLGWRNQLHTVVMQTTAK